MVTRRKFLHQTALGSVAATMSSSALISCAEANTETPVSAKASVRPLAISTWDFGTKANDAAMKILDSGGSALDAVEAGVMVIEADEKNTSVGIGGAPDRDGRVTLDACIMAPDGSCGSVCALEHIAHPISVARRVMEKTPHVILVGDGALEFALSQGFKKENLLTEESKKAWEEWKKTSKYEPVINVEMHDTIGMITIDKNGDIAGACTTSGLAYKMQGRVGDSPIIGAGMYVDNEVGGAAATGLGEAVIRAVGSFLVVELMRNGRSPQAACEEAVARVVKKYKDYKNIQVGFIAVNKDGETGGFSIHKGFSYAVFSNGKNEVKEGTYLIE
ncbi:MAG: N(4)-(beta-N-acetylglucosaminyl)-L-asparaginase [Saprospiraceae bacterium]|nr:N(4)-(beta-N-acetylglucosaminyl)-L-asparaginase [Saprospiraceae bacterium]MCF8250326.1 N(4)-(beta-N-acetylglucosaminyl)-L-asparaginase [Saprospiraceae bacterium]MCF8312134.1 N(4)-(beta-N-acetylglucosaminyl)-L-asparaginase [Saprospiraceae bacterium]MCF8442186.1 N(4)-(beta-N-acetylglucosaminyl)-L-asparaginase [Saprospiraceae bacterium]